MVVSRNYVKVVFKLTLLDIESIISHQIIHTRPIIWHSGFFSFKLIMCALQQWLSDGRGDLFYHNAHSFTFSFYHISTSFNISITYIHHNIIVCVWLKNAMEQKKYCCRSVLAMAQALDKVWRNGLLEKLREQLPRTQLHTQWPLIEVT